MFDLTPVTLQSSPMSASLLVIVPHSLRSLVVKQEAERLKVPGFDSWQRDPPLSERKYSPPERGVPPPLKGGEPPLEGQRTNHPCGVT